MFLFCSHFRSGFHETDAVSRPESMRLRGSVGGTRRPRTRTRSLGISYRFPADAACDVARGADATSSHQIRSAQPLEMSRFRVDLERPSHFVSPFPLPEPVRLLPPTFGAGFVRLRVGVPETRRSGIDETRAGVLETGRRAKRCGSAHRARPPPPVDELRPQVYS